ncbi:MAG: hypothetical protein F7B17_00725 [Desulfurococcales archaeon]|nr:hypothetical protein [Desulfurococcales archaeon]
MSEGGAEGRGGSSVLDALVKLISSSLEVRVEREVDELDYLVEITSGPLTFRAGFIDCRGKDPSEALGAAEIARVKYGLDKIVIVTSPGAAPKIASLNIPWIVAVDISTLEGIRSRVEASIEAGKVLYMLPRLDVDDVKRIGERHRGWIIRKGDFAGARLAFMPLYCLLLHAHSIDYTPLYLESETVRFCFELSSGSLVTFDDGLRLAGFWQKIGELSPESIDVLRRIADLGEASLAELKEEFSDKGDVDSIIEVLLERGLIQPTAPDTYSLASLPTKRLRDPLQRFPGAVKEGRPPCGYSFKPHVPPSRIREVAGLYGVVKEASLVYYPLVVIAYIKKSGERRIEVAIVVDGVTGARLGDVEELLSESPAVAEVDSIVDDIVARGGVDLCGEVVPRERGERVIGGKG